MIEFLGLDQDAWKVIGLTLGTCLAAVLGRRKMRMLASSDSVEVEANEATKSVYQTLRDENDRLRAVIEQKDRVIKELSEKMGKVFDERNAALMELSALRAETRILRENCGKLELRLLDMQRKIENLLTKGL